MNFNLTRMAQWSKFLGMVNFVGGIICCCTIVGAISGVIMIISGRFLINGSKKAKEFDAQGPIIDYNLNGMITEYKNYFMIQGILTIIGLAFVAIYIVILAIIFSLGINSSFFH